MLAAGTNDDPPPPYYTAIADTKIDQLSADLPGSFNPHNGQPHLFPAYPYVPPEYETVIYHPALHNSADASVILQPRQQQQDTTNRQVVESDSDVEEASGPYKEEACIFCCMGLCCCCPCILVSFM